MPRITSSEMPKPHVNQRPQRFYWRVVNSFDYKPGSYKFYIASKTSSFPLIPFPLFLALKSGVTIASQDHIYFSQPRSSGSLCILIPIALLLDSQKFPPTQTVSQGISRLITHYLLWTLNVSGLERWSTHCILETH